jgi:hypothetical protein
MADEGAVCVHTTTPSCIKDVPGGAVSSCRGIRQADVHIELWSDSGRGMRI